MISDEDVYRLFIKILGFKIFKFVFEREMIIFGCKEQKSQELNRYILLSKRS